MAPGVGEGEVGLLRIGVVQPGTELVTGGPLGTGLETDVLQRAKDVDPRDKVL